MSILNSRYSFLETDYDNPCLTQKVENSLEKVMKNGEVRTDDNIANKNLKSNLYLQLNWKFGSLVWIPADIFCIAFLVIVEILS
ncbi:hypothetical protein D1B33_09860 [Lysinibacillus yapensis]|uniref:Uncharacterized protein n=1 Tax=Ureibacillus yapensis TaxID=2304605 RepID=A0A396SDP1_9BACL|nr:hypothetical protein [Lysinibacillus yapensis]RHW36694.1 hypothetical protein D1B33_09860 [Lysinibacillus yapensis]